MIKIIYSKWTVIISLFLNVFAISVFSVWVWKHPTSFLDKIYPERTINIVMLGNSLTAGADWTKQLCRIDVRNSGFGGFITKQLSGVTKRYVIECNPKICFVEGGINDVGFGCTSIETFENIKSIVHTLKANKIIPVLSLTLYQHSNDKSKNKVDSINMLVKQYAIENDIDYFDLNEKLSENQSLKAEYTTDGTHLTKDAYPFWAAEVKKVLKKYNIE